MSAEGPGAPDDPEVDPTDRLVFVDVPSSRFATARQALAATIGLGFASILVAALIVVVALVILAVIGVVLAAGFATMLDRIYS